MVSRLQKSSFLLIIFLFAIVGCGATEDDNSVVVLATAQSIAETMVAVQVTELAHINPTAIHAPIKASPASEEKDAPTPQEAGGECLSASLSDETVLDYTVLAPGENFQKSCLLTNMRSCTWTEEYGLAFHHGNAMQAVQNALNINQVQLSFQFDSQSNSDGSNDNIGLSPNLSPFWYRID